VCTSQSDGQINMSYIDESETIANKDQLTTVDDILRKKMSYETSKYKRVP